MKNSRKIQAKALFNYNIFLIGFMGAGKSTIAKELKRQLEMNYVEMDQLIVEELPFQYAGGFQKVLVELSDALPYRAFEHKQLD